MNFVAQVEEHLRDLGSEARKKHPGVKEASERAILALRQLQNQYATAVRRSSSDPTVPHPTTALFRSQDVLRPFLLAANYPDAGFRLLTIALDAIDLLARGDAICPGDAVHVVRVVGIQGNVCAGALQSAAEKGQGPESAAVAAVASTITGLTGLAGSLAAGVGRSVGYGALGGGDDSYSSSAGMTGTHSHRSPKEDERIARRLVKTLTMIAKARGLDMTEEVLGQCLAVCLVLASVGGSSVDDDGAAGYGRPRAMSKVDGSDTMPSSHGGKTQGGAAGVRRAAASALKKIVAAVFERAGEASLPPQPPQLPTEGKDTSDENGRDGNDLSLSPPRAGNNDALAQTPQRPAALAASRHDADQVGILRTLAAQTFTDLCALADPHHKQFGAAHPPPNAAVTHAGRPRSGSSGGMPPGVTGPFAQALAGGVHHRVSPPPRSACLEVLDMVLKHRTNLFGSSTVAREGGGGGDGTDFRALLKSQACPLAAVVLMEDSSAVDRSSSSAGVVTAADFAMHLRSIKLASTIIAVYGGADDLTDECRILFACLVRAIAAAAEAYRDTDGFEDGYIYTPSERERLSPSLTGGGSVAKGQRSAVAKSGPGGRPPGPQQGPGQQAQNQRSRQRPPPREDVAVPAPTLWRAALSLESLYALIEEHFETLVWMHSSSLPCQGNSGDEETNGQRGPHQQRRSGHSNILAQMAEAISDFATVGASCRDSILGVVDAASFSSSLEAENQEGANQDVTLPALDSFVDPDGGWQIGSGGEPKKGKVRIAERARGAVRDDWGCSTSCAPSCAPSEDNAEDDPTQQQRKRSSPGKHQKRGYPQQETIGGVVAGSAAEVEGEALWIAYSSVLSMSRSLLRLSLRAQSRSSNNVLKSKAEGSEGLNRAVVKSFVDSAFAPSLALFQHFLKRFPASPILSVRTLEGYTNLSHASLPLRDSSAPTVQDDMHRRAVLSSLCKLSLPRWGKNDGTCQLCDHHVATLSTLFRIVHVDANFVGSEWAVVLSTWEQLSSLAISSTRLSAEGHKDAVRLSGCFSRISDFTTSLSTEALVFVVKALVDVSNESVGRKVGKSPRGSLVAGRENADSLLLDSNARESLGGKLMRAFTGGGTDSGLQRDSEASSSANDVPPSVESSAYSLPGQMKPTKTHGEEFFSSVYDRLFSSTKPTTRKEVFKKLPFSLVALTDIALSNSFRFEEGCSAVTAHLCDLAAHSGSGDVRTFSMDTLAHLITLRISGHRSGLAGASLPSTVVPNPLLIDDYLRVLHSPPSQSGDRDSSSVELNMREDEKGQELQRPQGTSQAELLLPLCETITSTDQHDTAEAGLNAVHVILEGAGHNLCGDSWPLLINAIAALSGHNITTAESDIDNDTAIPIDRSTADWAAASTLAFRCLKLIIDDFLDELPSPPSPDSQPTRAALLDCCAAFGSSRHDVNTSLTATGMLWTLADQDASPSSLNRVLKRLALLSSDDRAEVRNCSVNTLFSCVVGLGENFTAEQWEGCLCETIFGVMDNVSQGNGQRSNKNKAESKAQETSSRYKVSVHHSRDSAEKQKATTQTLTLRGLERVLRQFFPRLLATTADLAPSNEQPWFEMAWTHILSHAYTCATITTGGRDTLALRTAGADLLVLCAQLSCKAGFKAAATPARVGTNMQVVNGALRNVKSALPDAPGDDLGESRLKSVGNGTVEPYSADMEATRQELFLAAFGSVENFCADLEKGNLQDEEDGSNRFAYVESSLLQVLTKLSQGLGKVYECCKNDEMSPKPCKVRSQRRPAPSSSDGSDAGDLEGRMVNVISIVARNSGGESGSRFLTQSQRACLELLKNMSANGSSTAFQELAAMGGRVYFMRQSSSNSDDEEDGDSFESLEYESAKVVADAFSSGGVSKPAKLAVMCAVLEHFDDFLSGGSQRSGNPNFDLLVPVVQGGMDAASSLEGKGPDRGPEVDSLLDDAWKDMIEALSGLVSPIDSANMKGFSSLMKCVLEIASSAISNVPERHHSQLGGALANCSSDVVNTMKLFAAAYGGTGSTEDGESIVAQQESCLRVFVVCFNGLCQCQPNTDTLRALSEKFLRSAVDSSANQNPTAIGASDDLDNFDVEVEVALVVCSAVRSLPPPNELALSLFSWLCRLTGSSGSSRLRKEAGDLLGTIDVAGIVHRAAEAEYRAKEAEKRNAQLAAQIKTLEVENKELRHQAAVFAGTSAFT